MCGNHDALIHVQQIINGEVREINLCSSCAEMKGLGDIKRMDGLSLSELLGKIAGTVFETEEKESGRSIHVSCSGCGRGIREIIESNEMGCPECYNSFHSTIEGSVRDAYDGTIPSRLEGIKNLLLDRKSLQEELNHALEEEEYEKAALLRDEIEKIEHGTR